MRLNHPDGRAAEDTACAFLCRQGCRLVERNWHCRYGEIDAVVWDGGVLVFVEVRMRRSRHFGGAAASIDAAKLAKLQRSAEAYLSKLPSPPECRIDAVVIEADGTPQWLRNITG